MCKWMTGLTILWLLGCGGCGARVAESPESTLAPAVVAGPAAVAEAELANVSRVLPAAVASRASRTIEDDPDGDGIANYRVIFTDTFDAAGDLAGTLREEDFEADGIIDSRLSTSYGK